MTATTKMGEVERDWMQEVEQDCSPSIPLERPLETFVVILERPLGVDLGLELDLTDGQTASVVCIGPGPVARYNTTAICTEAMIQPFDRIVAANDARGHVQDIIARLHQDVTLRLEVHRPRPMQVNLISEDGSPKRTDTLVVILERPLGVDLGLELDLTDGQTASVVCIGPGPIARYNTTAISTEAMIQPFDCIVAANDARGHVQDIIARLHQDVTLRLEVRRPRPMQVNLISEDGSVGLDAFYAPSGMSLLISGISEGRVEKWNCANADEQIKPYDRIVSVNGVYPQPGSAKMLLEALAEPGRLELGLLRLDC